MKDRQHQPGGIPAPERLVERDPAISDAMNGILEKILQTREGRSLIVDTIPIVLQAWAGESSWRKIASTVVTGPLTAGFRETPSPDCIAIEALFEDPDFIASVADFLAVLFKSTEDVLAKGLQTLAGMPQDDKKKLTTSFISRLMNGASGDILTRSFSVINELQQNDPALFTQMIAPGFEKWVASVDFGEIKETVEGSTQSIVSLVQMANDIIWQYPAKVILLLSLLPSLANIAGSCVHVSARKLDEIPPDLLSDIVISMIREIDGSMVAGLINSFAEMGHKLHVGSALLGDTGAPQLPKLFSEKLSEIITNTDPIILWKFRIAFADIKASFDHVLAETIHQNEDHLRLKMQKRLEVANIRHHGINRTLTLFESMDDEAFIDIMTKGLSASHVEETAEVLNNVLRLINRLGDQNPKALADLISRFSSAIDDYALSETAHRLFSDANGYPTPAARSVVPGFVTWICRVLDQQDDEYEEDAMQAREALRSLLMFEKD